MKLVICAGPATTGKTTVLRHMARKLIAMEHNLVFLKIDVQYADEDEVFAEEFGIPTSRDMIANSGRLQAAKRLS